ncbi:MAG: alkaline phosphatase D family protein [Proteobacteria bacterium]|nr:alkaline phosphatase D family protein [Pseudomonadota bacterium]
MSCQHFETGYYAAYRPMLADDLDLVLQLGDYLYESHASGRTVRRHARGEPFTLEDYRLHHAQYRGDEDLKAAHAAASWLMVWDDHEVENDYAGAYSENDDPPAWFLKRRANAYRAYYEHMPLPHAMRPFGADMRIHTQVDYGALANFTLLDGRQYRSRQPCPPPGQGGSTTIRECAARLDARATFLGARQERWYARTFGATHARWNIVAQQMLLAEADSQRGPAQAFYSDAWGYPAARRRLLDATQASGARNPVFLGGDIHSFWVTDVKADHVQAAAPTLATEFVTTAVSSTPIPESLAAALRDENPHIRYGVSGPRGYLRMTCTAQHLQADLRALDDVTRASSACRTLASFVVADGRAGAEKV